MKTQFIFTPVSEREEKVIIFYIPPTGQRILLAWRRDAFQRISCLVLFFSHLSSQHIISFIFVVTQLSFSLVLIWCSVVEQRLVVHWNWSSTFQKKVAKFYILWGKILSTTSSIGTSCMIRYSICGKIWSDLLCLPGNFVTIFTAINIMCYWECPSVCSQSFNLMLQAFRNETKLPIKLSLLH